MNATATGAARSGSRRSALVIAAVLVVWTAAMIAAGASGSWARWMGVGPLTAIQLSIVLPPAAFACLVSWSASVRVWLRETDLARLLQWQVLRVLGASHLVSWGLGRIGGGFALPVGLGNLAISLLATHATLLAARLGPNHRRWALAVSLLGLAEFALTVALAVSGAFTRRWAFDPPVSSDGYASIRALPISLFPTLLIPLFSTLHLAVLFKLRLDRSAHASRTEVASEVGCSVAERP